MWAGALVRSRIKTPPRAVEAGLLQKPHKAFETHQGGSICKAM